MEYKIFYKSIKSRKIRSPWFTWIKWGFHRTYRKNSYVPQIFLIAGIKQITKKLKSYPIIDFGMLTASIEKYQPNLRKEIIILEIRKKRDKRKTPT